MDDTLPSPNPAPAEDTVAAGPPPARELPGRSSPRDRPARSSVRSLPGLSARLAAAWWRSLLPLGVSTAVLATVIGGAVGVGDAVGRGLLARATGRLGRVGAAVVAQRLFRGELAAELTACGLPDMIERLEPVVILDISAESSGGASVGAPVGASVGPAGRDAPGGGARASGPHGLMDDRLQHVTEAVPGVKHPQKPEVLSPGKSLRGLVPRPVKGVGGRRRTRTGLLACRDPSSLGWAWPAGPLAADTAAVNEPLAARLGVTVGDQIVLRTVARSQVASDSPLGRRDADPLSRRVTIVAVLPPDGIGGFGLSPSQVNRPLVIAPLESGGRLLRAPGSANGILAVLRPEAATAEGSQAAAAWIGERLRPTAADLGIEVRKDDGGVVRVSSTSLVLPPEVDRAAAAVLEPLGGSPALVLLANAIRAEGGGSVPYSTIAGCGSPALPYGSLETLDGAIEAPIRPGEIVINRWLADDLARQGSPVGVGSPLRVEWFAPETLHGRVQERSRVFTIAAVAEMQGAAVERSLVPEVEGVTDEASIADWDPPFPFDASRVRSTPPDDADDQYWKAFGATPKAFVCLDDAREMAAGRFGRTTTWHCRVSQRVSADAIARAIAEQVHPPRLGFAARPLLAEAIAAARGSTPFGGLFGALSAYLVVAGLVLVWLLAALVVTARRREIGVLVAVGWPRSRVSVLIWAVLGIAALAGAVAGALSGPVWAGVLVAWLTRSWTGLAGGPSADAVAAPVARPFGILAVALTGFAMAMAAAGTGAYRAAGEGVRGLLAGGLGRRARPTRGHRDGPGKARWAGFACLLVAGGVMTGVVPVGDELVEFFVGATLALVGLLALARSWILPLPTRSLLGLAWSGIAESPGRSFAVVAIVAVAEFLIVAVSAFAVREPVDPRDRSGPTGGYDLLVSLATPAALDLADPATLASAGLDPAAVSALADATLLPLRATEGDDASCLNLYRAQAPLVVGVDAAFRSRGGFRFTARTAGTDGPAWQLLVSPDGGDSDGTPTVAEARSRRVPVILDDSTARYALGLSGLGATIDIVDGGGSTRTLEVVGLLAPGILQGMLIVAEERFRELYPLSSGYRMLLADCGNDPAASGRVADAIGTLLGDNGAEAVTTLERLRVLGAVQNIYLAGFQSLGILGMLLGTAGVAATRLRSVLERQGAFALLLAIGFTPTRLRLAVLWETLLLVLPGLVIGAAAGMLAVLPQLFDGRAALPVGWLAASICLTSAAAGAAAAVVAGRAVARRPVSFLRAF